MASPSTAIHQAGHAVIAYRLGIRVHSVSVHDSNDSYGEIIHGLTARDAATDADHWESSVTRLAGAMIWQAGVLAQQRLADTTGPGTLTAPTGDSEIESTQPFQVRPDGDQDEVLRCAQELCRDDDERPAFYQWSDLHVKALVNRYWPDIQAVARPLVERRRLTGDEIGEILEGMNPSP